jgi:hypothetical protein
VVWGGGGGESRGGVGEEQALTLMALGGSYWSLEEDLTVHVLIPILLQFLTLACTPVSKKLKITN